MSNHDEALANIAHRIAGPGEDPAEIAAALAQSPAFAGNLDWLDDVLDAADFMPIHQVPDDVHESLLRILHRFRRPGVPTTAAELFSAIVAELVEDTRQGDLVGVRDAAQQDATDWTWVFASDAVDIVIDVSTATKDAIRVSGRLVGQASPAGPFQVINDQVAEPILADDHGRFVMRGLSRDLHTCSIEAAGMSLSWTMDLRE